MKSKLSLLLAACMLLGLLAGCGGEAAGSTSAVQNELVSTATDSAPESTPAQVPDEPQSAAEAQASVSDPSTEEPEVDKTITLPLTQDDVSFTMWHDFVPPLADYMDGMQDNLAYQTMEERTGVHMEITSVTKDSAATALSLIIASGDYPNLIDGFAGYYGQGIDTAIDADIILDLAEYKDLMTNYISLVDGNE